MANYSRIHACHHTHTVWDDLRPWENLSLDGRFCRWASMSRKSLPNGSQIGRELFHISTSARIRGEAGEKCGHIATRKMLTFVLNECWKPIQECITDQLGKEEAQWELNDTLKESAKMLLFLVAGFLRKWHITGIFRAPRKLMACSLSSSSAFEWLELLWTSMMLSGSNAELTCPLSL